MQISFDLKCSKSAIFIMNIRLIPVTYVSEFQLQHTFPIPHLVNISAVTLPTPPTPTTATVKSRIF